MDFTDPERKTQYRYFDKKDDALEFETHIRRTRQLIKAGMEAPQSRILVKDYAAEWVRRRFKDPDLTHSYVSGDARRLRLYWLEKFGLRPLNEIKTDEIKAQLDYIQFELGKSPAERNRNRALLHALFQDAFLDNRVLFNPIAKIPLKAEKSKRSRVALSKEDLNTYLLRLRADHEQYFLIGMAMAWTGCRVCTANVLQWQDVNFKTSTVRLCRLEERSTKTVVERQKDGEETYVPLLPVFEKVLKAHLKRTKYNRPTDFIAAKDDGGYVCYDTFKDAHFRAVEATGIQRVTPHDIRRTFATLAQQSGFSKSDIQELLGHSTVLVTEKYTQPDIEFLIQKSRKLGFGSTVKKQSKNEETTGLKRQRG